MEELKTVIRKIHMAKIDENTKHLLKQHLMIVYQYIREYEIIK